MSIEKTQAIILKTHTFSESSKIVRLYTRDFGKVSVLAKGARRPKSPFHAVLETGYQVEAIYYYKDNRELQTLSQCDLINSFSGIHEKYERTAAASATLELILSSTVGDESNPFLFNRIVETFNALTSAEKLYKPFYWNFTFHMLRNLGFEFNVECCVLCGTQLTGERFSVLLKKGGILCSSCSKNEMVDFSVSAETTKLIGRYNVILPDSVSRYVPSSNARREIDELLHHFMLFHLEGYKKPQSLNLLVE